MLLSSHLTDHQIAILLEQAKTELPGHFVEHLSACEHCQQRVELLAAEKDVWDAVKVCLVDGASIDADFSVTSSFAKLGWRQQCDDAIAKQLLDAPSHPEMLGRLGRYEVERVIGTGGMGIVFRAHDTELHRPVAIKMLAPHLSGSDSARSRFAREARAAAAIVNDHVVPIHNVETDHVRPYLVMQYIAGDSLQARLDREGSLELSEILRIGMQVAKGLAAAHAQGLIHRDVKPSNILLDENVSRALLTDFGLARTQDDACLTRSGFHPGTPHYMSPEQVRGEDLDGRSDLFGLGCVLYALCTGQPPFLAESGYAVMRRITDETPRSICQQNPDTPVWLERIVLRMLEKDKAQRFQSAKEVADLLEQCLAHVQKPNQIPLPESAQLATQSSPSKHNGMRKWIAGGLLGFVALFAGAILILETSKGTLTIKSETDNVPIRIKQSDKVVEELTVSRLGKTVRLAAGEYTIELENDLENLIIESNKVVLARRETKAIEIHFRKSSSVEGSKDDLLQQSSQEGNGLGQSESEVKKLQAAFDETRALFTRNLKSIDELAFAARDLIRSQVHLLRQQEAKGKPNAELKQFVMLNVHEQIQRLDSILENKEALPNDGLAEKESITATRSMLAEAKWIEQRLIELDALPSNSVKSPDKDDSNPHESSLPSSTAAPLSRAVTRFNQLHSEALRMANSPPLTEEEVIASLWQFVRDSHGKDDATHPLYQVSRTIAQTKMIPEGWSLQYHPVSHGSPDCQSKSMDVLLENVDHKTVMTIRRQYVSPGKCRSSSADRENASLPKAIAEFNKSNKDEPPLTLDETLAALWRFWEDNPSEDHPPADLIKTLALSLELQPRMKLQARTREQNSVGDIFSIWDIQLAFPDSKYPGAMRAVSIRKRYRKIERLSADTISQTLKTGAVEQPSSPTEQSETKPSSDSQLADAIKQFNDANAAQLQGANTPSLSEDEVRAALWWHASHVDFSSDARKRILEIVLTRKLPLEWSIQLNKVKWDEEKQWHGAPATSMAIEISLVNKEQYAVPIRSQFTHSGLASKKRPNSQLVEAIAKFNKSRPEDQPPLTLEETMAALSTILWKNQLSKELQAPPNFSNDAWAKLLQVADMQLMNRVTIESSFFDHEVGDSKFLTWKIELLVAPSDGNWFAESLLIRKRFLRVNSLSDDTIHWGKPSDQGVQAGFRLRPAQKFYLANQVVNVDFYYRKAFGRPQTMALPRAFNFNKILTEGTDGAVQTTLHDREQLIAGWHESSLTETATEFKGRQIQFVTSWAEKENLEREDNDLRTVVMLPADTKQFLRFEVPNFEQNDSEPLTTGQCDIRILPVSVSTESREWRPELSAAENSEQDGTLPNHFGFPMQNVTSSIPGVIVRIADGLKRNTHLKQGDFIAEIESTEGFISEHRQRLSELERAIHDASSTIEESVSTLHSAKQEHSTLGYLMKDLEQAKQNAAEAFKAGNGTQQAVLDAQSKWDACIDRFKKAEVEITEKERKVTWAHKKHEIAKRDLLEIQTKLEQLSRLRILAPISGKVNYLAALHVGDKVYEGSLFCTLTPDQSQTPAMSEGVENHGVSQLHSANHDLDSTSLPEAEKKRASQSKSAEQNLLNYPEEWRGIWTIEQAATNSGEQRNDYIGEPVAISAEDMFLRTKTSGNHYRISLLDCSTTPNRVDLTALFENAPEFTRTFECIFELDGDRMILVRPQLNGDRPASISNLERGETRFVLQRSKLKSLSPQEAILFMERIGRVKTPLVVEFPVGLIYTQPRGAGEMQLDFRQVPVDDKADQFVVVLTENCQSQLRKNGIDLIERHFNGKVIRATGTPQIVAHSDPSTKGTHFRLIVDHPDQVVVIAGDEAKPE